MGIFNWQINIFYSILFYSTPKKDNSDLDILGGENGSKKLLHHKPCQIIVLFGRVFITPCLTCTAGGKGLIVWPIFKDFVRSPPFESRCPWIPIYNGTKMTIYTIYTRKQPGSS